MDNQPPPSLQKNLVGGVGGCGCGCLGGVTVLAFGFGLVGVPAGFYAVGSETTMGIVMGGGVVVGGVMAVVGLVLYGVSLGME